ncbi:hypothetical protein [Taibaiella soli]|uniref:hypothetical protein n=1 Tax=Taibaiella soli TaxID=1649169 RepID=UPI000F51364E|nr:hypothetical protein [Taibaiella soli]
MLVLWWDPSYRQDDVLECNHKRTLVTSTIGEVLRNANYLFDESAKNIDQLMAERFINLVEAPSQIV